MAEAHGNRTHPRRPTSRRTTVLKTEVNYNHTRSSPTTYAYLRSLETNQTISIRRFSENQALLSACARFLQLTATDMQQRLLAGWPPPGPERPRSDDHCPSGDWPRPGRWGLLSILPFLGLRRCNQDVPYKTSHPRAPPTHLLAGSPPSRVADQATTLSVVSRLLWWDRGAAPHSHYRHPIHRAEWLCSPVHMRIWHGSEGWEFGAFRSPHSDAPANPPQGPPLPREIRPARCASPE